MNKGDMTGNLINAVLDAQQQQPAPGQAESAPKMSKAAKTTSVYLSAAQHNRIEQIAKELQTSKHAVLQVAIKYFIEQYDRGYRPEPVYKRTYTV